MDLLGLQKINFWRPSGWLKMSDPHMAEEGLVGEVVVEAEGMVGEEGEAGLEMTVAAAGKDVVGVEAVIEILSA